MKTVYDFVKHCIDDKEFNENGIPSNEKEWLDEIGIYYETNNEGAIIGGDDNMADFYSCMLCLKRLNDYYKNDRERFD